MWRWAPSPGSSLNWIYAHLYLKDLNFFGSTWQSKRVFENLIGYIERNEIRTEGR
ncbi:hypothetical protein [Marinobacter sp.]|uniref:hypothetical protein n=1 Tax=Marinobacter sp. TaxID=50741 RepID=UPI002B26AC84|nr:hypothetical protein [Marinobacter sp.]